MTSSFPSGHAASDLAFAIGAAQELPSAFLPLSACTMAVHWSLVRKRSHYPSDVLAGGALGMAVALAAWKLWPPRRSRDVDPSNVSQSAAAEGGKGPHEYGHSGNGAGASLPDAGYEPVPR